MDAAKILQSKTGSEKQDNKADIAGVMENLTGQMSPDSEDYHKFIRTISMPRDEEYVQLISKQIELLNKKEELLAELEEVEGKEETEQGFGMPEDTVSEDFPREDADVQKQEKAEKKTVQAVKNANTPSKEEIRKKEIEAELKRLDEEMSFLKKNLEDMFPESRRMQCMIYPSFRAGELIRAGVIKGQGWGYNGGEELCDVVKPETKRERAMLLLGDSILTKELDQVLNIEIYPEAVCVVYPNGLTKVYR